MRNHSDIPVVLLILSLLILPANALAQGMSSGLSGEEGVLVGRISHVEGTVLRYVPDEGSWVRAVKDSPFGLEDKLRSDPGSRAELILPNNTWFRMNGDTHLQLISIRAEKTELRMVHGTSRFMSRGSLATIQVSTPFGAVHAPAGTSFDLFVNDASLEVMALKGSVYFTRNGGWVRTEVLENSPSLIADAHFVTAGTAHRDAAWETWNQEREALWARNLRAGGVSARYLPSNLRDQAYALDDYGTWQRVYYGGAYSYLWRPLYVSAGWAPYTVGTWTLWYGDRTWIPHEPFGYVTHHFGSWVYTAGFWYWAPPVTSLTLHFVSPSLRLGVAWYPGRVAWIHRGLHIGWFPLAPHEPYYAQRRWCPKSVVVKDVSVVNITVNNYRYERHAVTMDRQRFHAADPFRKASVRSTARPTPATRINSEPATVQRQAKREQSRSISTPNPPSLFQNRNRQDSLPVRPSAREGASATNGRAVDTRSDLFTSRAPAPAMQRENNIGREAPREQNRSTALRTDSAPRRETRQLPVSPRRETSNNAENSRGYPAAPQVRADAPRATAPAQAQVRRDSERSAGEAGSAMRSLPQAVARGLDRARQETFPPSTASGQRQGTAPRSTPGRNLQNLNRGMLFSR